MLSKKKDKLRLWSQLPRTFKFSRNLVINKNNTKFLIAQDNFHTGMICHMKCILLTIYHKRILSQVKSIQTTSTIMITLFTLIIIDNIEDKVDSTNVRNQRNKLPICTLKMVDLLSQNNMSQLLEIQACIIIQRKTQVSIPTLIAHILMESLTID